MNEKQQQLLFDKGITNVPSDALCSDNALEESLGMVYDNGEHRMIQRPVVFMRNAPKILYVHKYNNDERYITLGADSELHTCIKWGERTYDSEHGYYVYTAAQSQSGDAILVRPSGDCQITSVGKTLVISDSSNLYFFIWDENKYTDYGQGIPRPRVELSLDGIDSQGHSKTEEKSIAGIYFDDGVPHIDPTHKEDYNNLIVGEYSELKRNLEKEKLFWGSFAVRVALRLYDGSYYHISNPILMFNKFHNTIEVEFISQQTCRMILKGQHLSYKLLDDYSSYKDVVRDVVLLVTKQQDWFDTTKDAILETPPDINETYITGNDKYYTSVSRATTPYFSVLRTVDPEEYAKNIYEDGVYYELCSLGLAANTDSWKDTRDKMYSNVLSTLTSQERIEADDYFSNCPLSGDFIYSYNMRLNVAGLRRGFFNGYDYFIGYDSITNHTTPVSSSYTIYVRIASENGTRVVKKEFTTAQKQGIWFFYPDTRANYVTIMKGTDCILDAELKEHPSLHGAYYFNGMLSPDSDDEPAAGVTPTLSDYDLNNTEEYLTNQLASSEVNVPFLFNASGYHTIGTGKIIGMASLTQALSQGQFGQYPLLVFSTDGIWAMSVDNTGIYTSAHPMSREVALEVNPCITQTDGAVFFASEKGLMVVVGNQVKCMSEQLSGKTNSFVYSGTEQTTDLDNFIDFLRDAFIAYDYRDSLLWLFDGKTRTIGDASYVGLPTCWIYSIKSGTFGKYDFGLSSYRVTNAVNYYPDFLLQNGEGTLSLMNRPNINAEAENPNSIPYAAKIITRPMKLENALALKSIMQIKHIHDIPNLNAGTGYPSLTFKMYGSNNLTNWVELTSLRGTPWKYFRFRYDFAGLKATYRFAGTMIVTQERRTDKLR